ncbi:MAG TPA: DUF5652 family protein [Verrucomicrobiae bacterium]
MNPILAVVAAQPPANFPPWLLLLLPVIITVAIWDATWKLIALWKSARNDQLAWFICLAIFNTVGILPILYILFFQRTAAPQPRA